jgi:hypothetical protein
MMEKGIENPTRRVEAVIATLTDPESMLAIEILQALDERRPEVWEERGDSRRHRRPGHRRVRCSTVRARRHGHGRRRRQARGRRA